MTYSIDTPPANGIALESNGVFNYTPNTDFTGADSFTYRVSNGAEQSLPATINITIGE